MRVNERNSALSDKKNKTSSSIGVVIQVKANEVFHNRRIPRNVRRYFESA